MLNRQKQARIRIKCMNEKKKKMKRKWNEMHDMIQIVEYSTLIAEIVNQS